MARRRGSRCRWRPDPPGKRRTGPLTKSRRAGIRRPAARDSAGSGTGTSFMRLARLLLIGLVPLGPAGCLHEADRPTWMNRIPLLGHTPEPGTAALTFVLVERPAGGEEINREVWQRID